MEEDIPLVFEIERKTFPYPFGETLINNIYFAAPELCYVIESENSIVGFLLGGYTTIPHQVHILSVAVDITHRGKGFGKSLLNKFISSTKSLGYTSIKLEVNVANQNAIKLYEQLGFQIVSKIRKYYQDDSDAYLMLKTE